MRKKVIVLLVMLMVLGLSGCGDKGKEELDPVEVTEENPENTDDRDSTDNTAQGRKDESWQAEYSILGNRYEQAVAADNIYGYYIRDGQVLMDSINKESFSVEDSFALSGAISLSGMNTDAEGNAYFLGEQEDGMGFWRINRDGVLQDFVRIELEGTEEADDVLLKGVCGDQSGNLYVWCEMSVPEMECIGNMEETVWHWEDRVYIKDGQLNPVFYVKIADMKGTGAEFPGGFGGQATFHRQGGSGYLYSGDRCGRERNEG